MTSTSASGIRLEIGAGPSPTKGYEHNDVNPFEDIEYVCNAWELPLADGAAVEVLANGVVEHLTKAQVSRFLKEAHRLLAPGGVLQFDVPDIRVWCRYLHDSLNGAETPFSADHIAANFWGWQRWPGDEHKWGWTRQTMSAELSAAGFEAFEIIDTDYGDPGNAHLYCKAVKSGAPPVTVTYSILRAKSHRTILQATAARLERTLLAPLVKRVKGWLRPGGPCFACYGGSEDRRFSVRTTPAE